ncbi:MAG: hypothetical protein KDE33_26295, partial [Bacteroidetes bacterium]|nr:hypothetical protein [Bacteroidota bacterium]
IRPPASVHPEPGSNSPNYCEFFPYSHKEIIIRLPPLFSLIRILTLLPFVFQFVNELSLSILFFILFTV